MNFKDINYKKGLSLGVMLWILMFVIVSIFIANKIYDEPLIKLFATPFTSFVIAFFLARNLRLQKIDLAICYAVIWMAIGLMLDYLVTLQFNPVIFSEPSLWYGYILAFLGVVASVKKSI